MDTILQVVSHRMAQNSSPCPSDVMKYSPTDSLKMNSSRENKRIERRKPNWTESENVFLLDQFAMHREILTCKATDASTNLRKQEIWRLICANLNQNNTLVRRTPAEVRRKWKNLVTAAKKEVWEMRHQIHISGGSGTNGRKISELSQRVLQLHSSGNINNQSNGIYGSLLSAGLLGNAGGGGDSKFGSKYADFMEDKSFIPAHFTPIITLSESNNNHIISGSHAGDGPPSPMMSDDDEDDQESSDSRNAMDLMSDSGVNDQEGMDLRVNVSMGGGGGSARHSYASSNLSRSGRSQLSGMLTAAGHQLSQHLRDNLLGRAGADLGVDDDEELLEDDEEVELALAAEKRYANYNGQLTNGGTITRRAPAENHINNHHGHSNNAAVNALANFHHAATTNGPNSAAAAAAAASVLLERQHLQHLQQLATAASLRPALNTSNNSSSSSSHNNGNGNAHHLNNHNQAGQGSEEGSTSTTNLNRKCSESTEEISQNGVGGSGGSSGSNAIIGGNGDILSSIRSAAGNPANNFLKLKNHFAAALQESDLLSNLYKERLQLQIEVLKLRREKLSQELNNPTTGNNSRTGNGIIRKQRFLRCGLRLLRGKNNTGSTSFSPLNRNNLYKARMNRLKQKNYNHVQVNNKSHQMNGDLALLNGGSGGGNNSGSILERKRSKFINGEADGDEELDREISDDVEDEDDDDLNDIENHQTAKDDVAPPPSKQEIGITIKKESEGNKCIKLVNGDGSGKGVKSEEMVGESPA